jgi:RNA polymerase sigma factor (sigma-70 family)
LEYLRPRQAAVLRLRFGLNGEGPQTLKEIAQQTGVTCESVRQLEVKALARLRKGTA